MTHPKPFLKPRLSVYNTQRSHADGVFARDPTLCLISIKSTEHFILSYQYNSPKIWNDLPNDVRSAMSLYSFRIKLKIYIFTKAYPTLVSGFVPIFLQGADPTVFRSRLSAIKVLLESEIIGTLATAFAFDAPTLWNELPHSNSGFSVIF